jgi:hypothetical protein
MGLSLAPGKRKVETLFSDGFMERVQEFPDFPLLETVLECERLNHEKSKLSNNQTEFFLLLMGASLPCFRPCDIPKPGVGFYLL